MAEVVAQGVGAVAGPVSRLIDREGIAQIFDVSIADLAKLSLKFEKQRGTRPTGFDCDLRFRRLENARMAKPFAAILRPI